MYLLFSSSIYSRLAGVWRLPRPGLWASCPTSPGINIISSVFPHFLHFFCGFSYTNFFCWIFIKVLVDRYRMLAKTLVWELSTGFRVVLNYTRLRGRCIQNTGTHHGEQRHSTCTGLLLGPRGGITACVSLCMYFVPWNMYTNMYSQKYFCVVKWHNFNLHNAGWTKSV